MPSTKRPRATKPVPEIKIEQRLLKDLVPHPRQSKVFPDLSDAELQGLAEDIQRNGLKQLIEILPENSCDLPANTILNGHQRKRALELLGRSEVRVRVRYDLGEKPLDVIESVFLSENFARRQLSKLSQCRVARLLYQLEARRTSKDRAEDEASRARDRVGEMVGMSGRHLDRYWKALDAPSAVQAAYERGEITLNDVLVVAALPATQQKQVAHDIQQGEPAKQLIRKLTSSQQRGVGKRSAPDDFAHTVEAIAALTQTKPKLNGVSVEQLQHHAALLKNSSKTIALWIKKLEQHLHTAAAVDTMST